MQQAGDQGLIGKALLEGALLDGLQVFAGDADVDATVLAQGRLDVASIAVAVALRPLHRSPFTTLDRGENFFSSASSFIVLGLPVQVSQTKYFKVRV